MDGSFMDAQGTALMDGISCRQRNIFHTDKLQIFYWAEIIHRTNFPVITNIVEEYANRKIDESMIQVMNKLLEGERSLIFPIGRYFLPYRTQKKIHFIACIFIKTVP